MNITTTNIINNIARTIINKINMLRGFFSSSRAHPTKLDCSLFSCLSGHSDRKYPSFPHSQHSFPLQILFLSLFSFSPNLFLLNFPFFPLELFPKPLLQFLAFRLKLLIELLFLFSPLPSKFIFFFFCSKLLSCINLIVFALSIAKMLFLPIVKFCLQTDRIVRKQIARKKFYLELFGNIPDKLWQPLSNPNPTKLYLLKTFVSD